MDLESPVEGSSYYGLALAMPRLNIQVSTGFLAQIMGNFLSLEDQIVHLASCPFWDCSGYLACFWRKTTRFSSMHSSLGGLVKLYLGMPNDPTYLAKEFMIDNQTQ